MKKLFLILAVLFTIAAVCLGTFLNAVPGAEIAEIAAASFALLFTVLNAIKAAKERGEIKWTTYLIIIFAVIGGAFFALGGATASIIPEIIGAVSAVIAIILALITATKKA